MIDRASNSLHLAQSSCSLRSVKRKTFHSSELNQPSMVGLWRSIVQLRIQLATSGVCLSQYASYRTSSTKRSLATRRHFCEASKPWYALRNSVSKVEGSAVGGVWSDSSVLPLSFALWTMTVALICGDWFIIDALTLVLDCGDWFTTDALTLVLDWGD
jgi:hypothetical protein